MSAPISPPSILSKVPVDVLIDPMVSFLSIDERARFSLVSKECKYLVSGHLIIKMREISKTIEKICHSGHCRPVAVEFLSSIDARIKQEKNPTYLFLFSCFKELAKGPLFIERTLILDAINRRPCPINEELNFHFKVREDQELSIASHNSVWIERRMRKCIENGEFRKGAFVTEYMDEADQGFFLNKIVLQLCKRNRFEQASFFVSTVAFEGVKSRCLKSLSISLAKIGKFDEAIEEAQKITRKETMRYTLKKMFYEASSQHQNAHRKIIENLLSSCV